VGIAGSIRSSRLHSRSALADLAHSALLRPPRAASAVDTGFARAVSLTLGAVRLHIETLSYKREARLLTVCRVRLEVHIAEFAGCDQARSAATKARTGARQSGGWRSWWLLWWQSHRFRCAAKTGRGIADEDRASAMFVDAGDRCRPAIAPRLAVGGRHARRAARQRRRAPPC
jgi:hypothetical protein